MTFCSTGCGGLGQSPPSAGCYEHSIGCNLVSPNLKYDPHRKYFCQKFGQYAPDSCREEFNPCAQLHRSLRSLDEFSIPPLYRRGGYQAKFRCKAPNCIDNCCNEQPSKCSDRCLGIPQLPKCYRPNPKPYGDVVCGLCMNSKDLESKSAGCIGNKMADGDCGQNQDGELPFVIYPLWTSESGDTKKVPKRSGVSKCIHPSSFRSLDSVSKLEYLNFFKMKSPEDLALYQSKLAVDNRRPPVCLPRNVEEDGYNLDLSRPIMINAKLLNWKQKGKRLAGGTTVSVCVPGPITVG